MSFSQAKHLDFGGNINSQEIREPPPMYTSMDAKEYEEFYLTSIVIQMGFLIHFPFQNILNFQSSPIIGVGAVKG